MKKIAITAGKGTGDEAAFCPERMAAAGVNDADLSQALSKALGMFSGLLRDGCGVAVIASGDGASITGLRDLPN